MLQRQKIGVSLSRRKHWTKGWELGREIGRHTGLPHSKRSVKIHTEKRIFLMGKEEQGNPELSVSKETADMERVSSALSAPNPSWFTPKRYLIGCCLVAEIKKKGKIVENLRFLCSEDMKWMDLVEIVISRIDGSVAWKKLILSLIVSSCIDGSVADAL